MPAPVDLFRPLAMDWLRQVDLDHIDPISIVKSYVDSGKVSSSMPRVFEPDSIYISEKGTALADTRSYHFSIEKRNQGMRYAVYCKYLNGQLDPYVKIRIVDIPFKNDTDHRIKFYELTKLQEIPLVIPGNDHVKAARKKYFAVLGNHFSMKVQEVAEGLKQYIESGSCIERIASNQHPDEEGLLDHQIPIATRCSDKVPLSKFDPFAVVEAALEADNIFEDTADITPAPEAVFVYRKDKRLVDKMKWLSKRNRSYKNQIFEIYHGITEGRLNQMIKITCPSVHCDGGDFRVVWYFKDEEPHNFRTYCQHFMDALGKDDALRLIEDEIQGLRGPPRGSLNFILNSEPSC